MVYSKRDSPKQEKNGNADFRNITADNKASAREGGSKQYYNRYDRPEDVDQIKETPYAKYQEKINGSYSQCKEYPVYNQKLDNPKTPRPIR